jgi:aminomethyltransferase
VSLRRSPLHRSHLALGAKLVEFGGWEMPLAYPDGTVAEHLACRRDAVAFDVSHLGTVRLEGPDAFARIQATLTNDLGRIGPGRAQYTHLLDDSDASVVDDLIVWWREAESFDVMPNASNTARVVGALGGVDVTADRAVVAVQGPAARARLAQVSVAASEVARFAVGRFSWEGAGCVAAGTGYTGEDGVECAIPVEVAESFWAAVLAAGVTPAGLGARDTLRLEAGLPLHGHELGPGITPLQAGLGWVVRWDKGDFRGRRALEVERANGVRRRLVGLVAEGRKPPRAGDSVLAGGEVVGRVTSGNFSPCLGRGIGLALVDAAWADAEALEVEARGRRMGAVIAPTPFVEPSPPFAAVAPAAAGSSGGREGA